MRYLGTRPLPEAVQPGIDAFPDEPLSLPIVLVVEGSRVERLAQVPVVSVAPPAVVLAEGALVVQVVDEGAREEAARFGTRGGIRVSRERRFPTIECGGFWSAAPCGLALWQLLYSCRIKWISNWSYYGHSSRKGE